MSDRLFSDNENLGALEFLQLLYKLHWKVVRTLPVLLSFWVGTPQLSMFSFDKSELATSTMF